MGSEMCIRDRRWAWSTVDGARRSPRVEAAGKAPPTCPSAPSCGHDWPRGGGWGCGAERTCSRERSAARFRSVTRACSAMWSSRAGSRKRRSPARPAPAPSRTGKTPRDGRRSAGGSAADHAWPPESPHQQHRDVLAVGKGVKVDVHALGGRVVRRSPQAGAPCGKPELRDSSPRHESPPISCAGGDPRPAAARESRCSGSARDGSGPAAPGAACPRGRRRAVAPCGRWARSARGCPGRARR